jgi:hypothetical protein
MGMPEYVFKQGDTLPRIARSHGFQYWPNIYFAKENNAFRASHPNLDKIPRGHRIFIPSRSSVAPMERQPKLVYSNIPLFTQSLDTCWLATGKMLYCRQHPVATAQADFERLAGKTYLETTKSLKSSQWHDFYCNHLGMRQARIASPNDLHYIIASRGPAVVAVGGSDAHSMVMAGYDLVQGRWFVLDPAPEAQLDFADEVVTVGKGAGAGSSTAQQPTKVTRYRTAPATLTKMGRWLWILDTTVHQSVFHY